MALLEGIRIKNYRALRDIQMGRLSGDWADNVPPLTPLVAVIGKNGAGKSSIFDAFGFLADCLTVGVEEACDLKERGGFNRLRSAGATGPIEFELYFRPSASALPTTYELAIDLDKAGRPGVAREALRQRRKGMEEKGRPLAFLYLEWGKGKAWKGNTVGENEDSKDKISVRLTDYRHLGIATLGALKEHPRIAAFRNFIASWYLSYFTPDAARGLPKVGPQKHLNLHGDNLANVVQFMEREHRRAFKSVLSRVASKIPGLIKIDTKPSEDDRLLLRFWQEGFKKPFYAQQMSDGTLKVFAYLLLLEDPALRSPRTGSTTSCLSSSPGNSAITRPRRVAPRSSS